MHKLGNDLWNNEQKKFDKNTLQVLLDHITGKPNATMGDVEALFSGKPIYTNATTKEASGEGDPNGTYHQEYSSKVVKSDMLNRNASKITPGIGDDDVEKGLCVTLKGKVFRVASLTRTLPTAEKPDGDIVATLLLKEPMGEVQWNHRYDQNQLSAEPSNMYGTSDIRQTLIGKGGWLESFVGGDKDFAVNYLVQPKHIGYQHEQSATTRWKDEWGYSLPNEALSDVGGYYSYKKINDDYYNNGDDEKRANYISWGNDFAWLPSLTEIGGYHKKENIDRGLDNYNICSIWGMMPNHIGWSDKSGECAWLRSGRENNYSSARMLIRSGDWYDDSVAYSYGLRPALDLNLSSAIISCNGDTDCYAYGSINQPCQKENKAMVKGNTDPVIKNMANSYTTHSEFWDLWDKEEQKFNEFNVQMLVDYITGKHNATMDDVEALFSGDPIYTNATTKEASGEGDPNGTYHQEYSSKVVKSDLLNRNANKITPGIGDNDVEKGLCVTLKGKEFRVTSLTRTLPTAENPDGDIVATLLLKEPEGEVIWNSHYDQGPLSAEPSNMYGTSDIRQTLIGKGGWLESFIGSDINCFNSYLVQPKYIGYQYEQSFATQWKDRWAFSMPNEALGDVGDYYSNNNEDYDYYNNGGAEDSNDQLLKRDKYTSWGKDYVWLPSLIEIGESYWNEDDQVMDYCGIWGLSPDHIGWCDCSNNKWAWLRSGSVDSYNYARLLDSSGDDLYENVKDSLGLRPALHLNLSTAIKSCNGDTDCYVCENIDQTCQKENKGIAESSTATVKENIKVAKKTHSEFWDLWDKEEQKFDEFNVQMLVDYITGKPNATMGDVEALFSGEPIYTNARTEEASGEGDPNGTYHQEYSSKVVKSDLLNRNANKITPGISDNDVEKGLCVTLKGKEFRVTSLTRTLPTANNPDGDIVVTLLLKEPEWEMHWNSETDEDSLSPKPSNMYGTSDIRYALLDKKEGWLESFINAEYGFADCYFVKPNRIGYQHEQSITTRWKNKLKYTLPNEALGDVGGYFQFWKYYNDKMDADYYNNGGPEGSREQLAKRNAYIFWGDDYAWLPSLSEIGSFAWDHSIWGMSKEHRCYDGTQYSWLRSGNFIDSGNAYSLSPLGVESDQPVDLECALRPAIHLNLSAILENRKPTEDDNECKDNDTDDSDIIDGDSTANVVSDNESIAKDSVKEVEITALDEIWNQGEHKFDRKNFQTLLSHIAGVPNATLANVELLFSGKPIYTNLVNKTNSYDVDILGTYYNEYGSKVVKSWIINKNANKITLGIGEKVESKGLTVTLKGHVFRVISLTRTLPTADKPDGDIVATLMLKEPALNAKWNYRKDNGCLRAEPSNMYATSSIRRKTLPTWQAKFVGSDRSFAREYLVPPKYIGYQHKQSLSTRWFKEKYSHESMPNEALGDVGGFWEDNEDFNNYSYDYYKDYDNDFYAERRTKYLSWGDDYVWLPSLCEIGSSTCTWNIWGICEEQIRFSSEQPCWLRSGDDGWNGYKCAAYLYSNGEHSVGPVTHSYGLRPAMHLNISAIANQLNIVSATEVIDNETVDNQEVMDTAVSELWDGIDQKFNSANLHSLLDHLSGVKDATIEDVNALFIGEPVSNNTAQRETSCFVNLDGTYHQEYSSKVVKSDIINKNASKITLCIGDKVKSKGLTVTLKGEVFRVTSLTRTLPTADKLEGDIAVTLMLRDARQKLKWNEKEYCANKANEPTDMYGTSDIRKAMIGAGGWQDRFIGADEILLNKYLIQPKRIGYQHEQRAASRQRNYEKNNEPNEALDDVGGFCVGHDYYNNGDADKRKKYVAWGNDYFWLPSKTEIGGIENTHSIWGMALQHIVPEPGTRVWLRSASSSGTDGIRNVDGDGFNGLNNNAARSNGLRPAMHLNLSAAVESLLSNPIQEDDNTLCEDNAIECEDIGNCYELYNEQEQNFDQSSLRRLYSLLTGIDNADFDDVEALFQSEPMEDEDDDDYDEEVDGDEEYDEDEDIDSGSWVEKFGSKLVLSNLINANANKLGNNNRLTVSLKGKFFLVTSLTRTMPTDDNPEGDIVATLLLKEPERNVIWNSHDDQSTRNMEPSNMYGTSYIRCKVLPTWLEKFIGDDANFPANYLARPRNIAYQLNQSLNELNTGRYSLPNDALGDVGYFYEGYGYYGVFVSNDYYYGEGGEERRAKYVSWGKDYVWLPSLTEVSLKCGIWNAGAKLGFENYSSAWLRSGYECSPYHVYYISKNGGRNQTGVEKDHGLRPAMHLNLSAANRSGEGLKFNLAKKEVAEKAHNPLDLWNAVEQKFNNDNMQRLISRLTGVQDATMKDVAALFSGDPIGITAHRIDSPSKLNLSGTYHMEYRSKVVKWDLLRENAVKVGDNNGHGIIVILKGEEFIVTSLTKTIPTVGGNPNGDIVVTLLQMKPRKESSWNENSLFLNTASEPSNMYGSSTIRKALIGAGGWQEAFIGADSNFADDYLIEPDRIDYQCKQSAKSRWKKREFYNLPNEALGNVGGFMKEYDYYDDSGKYRRNLYIDWGNDYVWLPSLTEIGSTTWTHSIWGTSPSRISWSARGLDTKDTVWLRSSSRGDYRYVYTFSYEGKSYTENVELRYLLRPALHLNLSAAANYWESNATDDLWDDQKHAFDADNLQTLYNHITGIKNATMIDIDALFRGKPIYTNAVTEEASGHGDPKGTYHQEYSSKVVKSDLLNSNANKITPGIGDDESSKGLCVTIKGRIFRITSLTRTLPTAENPNGDIVATLLLKKPEKPSIWNHRSVKSSLDDEPPGMYGSSHIRKHVLPMWQNNFMGVDTYFADKFLVQPNRIGYQHEQSMATRWLEPGAHSLSNDALGNVGRYYHGAHTLENQEDLDYYNNGDVVKREKYISWGNDYVWLPSLTEMGSRDWTQSIWGMSTAHISFDYAFNGKAWLRSGEQYFGAIRYLNEQGYDKRANVYSNLDLRPAMHLNLSAADRHSTRWLPPQEENGNEDPKGDSIVEAPKDDSTEE